MCTRDGLEGFRAEGLGAHRLRPGAGVIDELVDVGGLDPAAGVGAPLIVTGGLAGSFFGLPGPGGGQSVGIGPVRAGVVLLDGESGMTLAIWVEDEMPGSERLGVFVFEVDEAGVVAFDLLQSRAEPFHVSGQAFPVCVVGRVHGAGSSEGAGLIPAARALVSHRSISAGWSWCCVTKDLEAIFHSP